MSRREFPKAVKVAALKRAMDATGVVRCEECGGVAKRIEYDHVIADSHGGDNTLDNCKVLCKPCHDKKTKVDTTVAAKIKRVEARHYGVFANVRKIPSRPFPKRAKESVPRRKRPVPPRPLFE